MKANKKNLLPKINLLHYLFFILSLVIALISILAFYNIQQRGRIIHEEIKRIEMGKGLISDLQRCKDIIIGYTTTENINYIKEVSSLLLSIHKKLSLYSQYVVDSRESYPPLFDIPTMQPNEGIRNDLLESPVKVSLGNIAKEIGEEMDMLNKGESASLLDNALLMEIENRLSSAIQDIDQIIAINLERISFQLQQSNTWVLSIIGFYILVSILGTILIVMAHQLSLRRIINPISSLIEATNSFIRGEKGARVEVISEDELGKLSQVFNQMAETIEAKEEALLELNQGLEIKVKERTRELEETYNNLKKTQNKLIASERLAIAGKIASRVGHSVLTPLSSIAVNLEVLQRCFGDLGCSSDREGCTKSLKVMHEELRRVSLLVEGYVKYSKPLSSQKRVSIFIEDVIDEAVLLFFNKAEKAGVEVEKRYHGKHRVFVDKGQMREVFLNLGNNAIEAMNGGGIIFFDTSNTDDNVTVKVIDKGPGIKEEIIKDLFSPFNSTKEFGLGLGLHIARNIVESHGGSIDCESSEGKGTTFVITIPAARNNA